MQCPRCNRVKRISEKFTFCPYCGSKLHIDVSAEEYEALKNRLAKLEGCIGALGKCYEDRESVGTTA